MKAVLNTDFALEMLGGEKTLLKELLVSYMNDTPFDAEKVRKFAAEGKNTEGAGYVHYYKGSARQIGAEQLAEAGQNLEDVLRGKKSGDIPSLADAFEDCYKTAVSAMKSWVSSSED